jgi:hypothetical protein
MSNKARATEEWDLSDPSEEIDWHSEYIARHAQLSASWLSPEKAGYQDIRGVALFEESGGRKLVGPLEDGSLSVWDFNKQDRSGPVRHVGIDQQSARTLPGILFDDSTARGKSSQSDAKRALAFSGVADCVSVDADRRRAYVAVQDLLSEVDLGSLQIVSQTKYAWSITALSQIQSPHQPLTVGTSLSLHILDPRSPPTDSSRSPAGKPGLEDSIAFFPNKDCDRNVDPARRLHMHNLDGFGPIGPDPQSRFQTPVPTSFVPGRRSLISYAQLEPAPLSILHQTDHSIMVAGRFPSILNYDRRYFPRLEYVIHSSARLSALAYLPFYPCGLKRPPTAEAQGTLISCGEYNGRGSLELYSVPRDSPSGPADPWSSTAFTLSGTFSSDGTAASNSGSTTTTTTTTANQTPPEIYSYQNRQSISSAKLLSVAAQGTRIVFSDADGGLKWVERDGKSIVRRWNVNSYQIHQESFPRLINGVRGGSGGQNAGRLEAAVHGEEVVRKIIPTGTGEADDLLVWTGERVGLVSFGRSEEQFYDAEEGPPGEVGKEDVVKSFDGLVGGRKTDGEEEGGGRGGGGGDLEERARKYDRQMRRALETQADELNWMNRFGFRNSP